MRADDLRTVAYETLSLLGARLGPKEPALVHEWFAQAKVMGLIDYKQNDDGTIYVFPLASKPITQVAGVQGIDSHGGMGER